MNQSFDQDPILYFDDVAKLANEMGMRGTHGRLVTERQVRRWADTGKIPVFRDFAGQRCIQRSKFIAAIKQRQLDAVNDRERTEFQNRRKATR